MHRLNFAAAYVAIGLVLFASTIAQAKDVSPNWKKFEADNGAIYQIDLNSIFHYNNGATDVVVYVVSGSGFNPENMHRLWFDCAGQYRDTTGPSFGPLMNVPPKSMAGRFGEIACAGAKDERRTSEANQNPPGPNNQSRTYDLKLSATRSSFPSISGATNLPDGTKLLVSVDKPRLPNAGELLAKGLPMCEDNCLPASGPKGETLGAATSVRAGAFSAGPFSWAGKPFQKGSFTVNVFLVSLPGEASSAENVELFLERMKKPVLSSSVDVAP